MMMIKDTLANHQRRKMQQAHAKSMAVHPKETYGMTSANLPLAS